MGDGGAYCFVCRTPYRMDDLVEVSTSVSLYGRPSLMDRWMPHQYVCRWHHARGMR
jgi:hypothetical protein